jgi:hypothetical protein
MMLRMSQSVRPDMGAKLRANDPGLSHVKARAGVRNAGTLIVLVHMAVVLVHGSGHTHLGIGTNLWQTVFIAIVILAGPLIAMILLWTRMQRTGVLLLGVTMAGSLVFGLYYHFIAPGADNALGVGHSAWGTAFLATSVLLAAIEAVACGWCFLVLRSRTIPNPT